MLDAPDLLYVGVAILPSGVGPGLECNSFGDCVEIVRLDGPREQSVGVRDPLRESGRRIGRARIGRSSEFEIGGHGRGRLDTSRGTTIDLDMTTTETMSVRPTGPTSLVVAASDGPGG
jgi:hypothetical protein